MIPASTGINNPTVPTYELSGEAYPRRRVVRRRRLPKPQSTGHRPLIPLWSPGFFLAAEHAVYSNLAPSSASALEHAELNLGSTNQFIDQSLWEQPLPRALP